MPQISQAALLKALMNPIQKGRLFPNEHPKMGRVGSSVEAAVTDQRAYDGGRPVLVGVYRVWVVAVFVSFAALGIWLGYTWGIGGSILGIVVGIMLAGMVMMVLNTPEKLEAAIYTTLGIAFVGLIIYLIIAYWGVRL